VSHWSIERWLHALPISASSYLDARTDISMAISPNPRVILHLPLPMSSHVFDIQQAQLVALAGNCSILADGPEEHGDEIVEGLSRQAKAMI
jgi:hypothetical protein